MFASSPFPTLGVDDAQEYNSPSTQSIECFFLAVSRPVQDAAAQVLPLARCKRITCKNAARQLRPLNLKPGW